MGAAVNGTNPVTKHYLKGQKLKIDSGSTAMIMDFDAQTLTAINNDQKTYTVRKFSELGQAVKDIGADVKLDVKETGQRKIINGFSASQIVMTMMMESAQAGPQGMKMQIEMEMWISPDVPGAKETHAFYQKNAEHFPWASMAGAGNPSMQKSMAEVQRKMATMNGVMVLQVMRMKSAGADGDARMQQMQAGMEQARARIEEMKKQGGQQAAMAEQMLARMGAARGGAGGGALMEITTESGDFSTAAIPDSVFAIPTGYQKK